jgi:hypothetical protein
LLIWIKTNKKHGEKRDSVFRKENSYLITNQDSKLNQTRLKSTRPKTKTFPTTKLNTHICKNCNTPGDINLLGSLHVATLPSVTNRI